MPTIFSHAVFATAIGKAALSKPQKTVFWLLAALCAMIPDADVITRSFGVERDSLFSHRGITHSIFFALLFGALIALLAQTYLKTNFSFVKLFAFFSLATFTHPFLDMLTDGGSGVALLAPFSSERFFLPWRPIEVSPIGFGFFSERGIVVILSEMFWVWLPALAIFGAALVYEYIKKRHTENR